MQHKACTVLENFEQIINAPVPVIVDFYADWCGPCKAMEPIVKNVADELRGKVRVIKVNIDKNTAAAGRFNIRSVPTFLIFKQGIELWRHSGMIDKGQFIKQVMALS